MKNVARRITKYVPKRTYSSIENAIAPVSYTHLDVYKRQQTDLTNDAVYQLMSWAAEKTAPREENESLRNIAEAYVKVCLLYTSHRKE